MALRSFKTCLGSVLENYVNFDVIFWGFCKDLRSLLGPILEEKKLFWVIFWVYKLDSDFVSVLGLKFNGFLIPFWLFFWNVFYMSCVSGKLRECTFYLGKT